MSKSAQREARTSELRRPAPSINEIAGRSRGSAAARMRASSSRLGRYTSGFRFGGRRIFADGSLGIWSSTFAQPKNEWRTEITFERVDALAHSHRLRNVR